MGPLTHVPKKDPQKAIQSPQLPPGRRSRAALFMSAAAATGEFALQRCRSCGNICYPPRDACPQCLSVDVLFVPVDGGGELIAETVVRTTTDPYFRALTPLRVGVVRLDCGPSVIAHLCGDIGAPSRVRVTAKLDKGGNAALVALPVSPIGNWVHDKVLKEMTASPASRRVLVTDARSSIAEAVTEALLRAGASTVFLGVAQPWKPWPGQKSLVSLPNVEVVSLDITDTDSVQGLAGQIGGKTDIIVNTASYVRPGGLVSSSNIVNAQQDFDVNVHGLQRLAQAFGPIMKARGADGVNSAAAFVDVLSVYALGNLPSYGVHSASAAARLSMLQCLRSELREGGVRVMSVFTGPLEDEWYQNVPPPKVNPRQVAEAIVVALEEGIEDTFAGDVAQDVLARFRSNPKVLERELGK